MHCRWEAKLVLTGTDWVKYIGCRQEKNYSSLSQIHLLQTGTDRNRQAQSGTDNNKQTGTVFNRHVQSGTDRNRHEQTVTDCLGTLATDRNRHKQFEENKFAAAAGNN